MDALLADAPANFLAANVGDTLHDSQVIWLKESVQRMLAVNDADDLSIAFDRHGHFTAATCVVNHVIRIFISVCNDFRNS